MVLFQPKLKECIILDYKELLEILRKDLNFKKVDLYQEKSNKTRYREIELGEKSPTIEELISFTDTLGIRLSEFLYRGDITPLAASYYGKRKIEVSSLINNFPELEKQFPEIYKDRFKNLQCYTLFTLCLIISKSLNNSLYTFKNKDIRELKNFYKNREVILGADYAILSHLYMAVPEYSN
ncbi:TPA: XRE family transcriptional regulator, partial [Enterococcus faecalis]|nr:XRE family transcriptional regulator [Enterococcus faecalis]